MKKLFNTKNGELYVKLHVFEPEESSNKESWYKDLDTFSNCSCFNEPVLLNVADIIEDNMGARFRIISKHWKWEKIDIDKIVPILEFTAERYIRRGKQNPFML